MINIPYAGLRPVQSAMPTLPVMQGPSNINRRASQAAASALANAPAPDPSPWPGLLQSIANGLAQPVAPGSPASTVVASFAPQSVTLPSQPGIAVQPASIQLPNSFSASFPQLPPLTVLDALYGRIAGRD